MIQKPINFKKDLNRHFSQALTVGDFIFLSAQLPVDITTGKLVSDDFREQARQCFRNNKTILKECDLPLKYVLKTTVFMTDIGNIDALDEVYAEFLHDPLPTRTVVGVSSLQYGAQVQIEVYCIDSRALEVLCSGDDCSCDGIVCEIK